MLLDPDPLFNTDIRIQDSQMNADPDPQQCHVLTTNRELADLTVERERDALSQELTWTQRYLNLVD
jgi:hypothetical protein